MKAILKGAAGVLAILAVLALLGYGALTAGPSETEEMLHESWLERQEEWRQSDEYKKMVAEGIGEDERRRFETETVLIEGPQESLKLPDRRVVIFGAKGYHSPNSVGRDDEPDIYEAYLAINTANGKETEFPIPDDAPSQVTSFLNGNRVEAVAVRENRLAACIAEVAGYGLPPGYSALYIYDLSHPEKEPRKVWRGSRLDSLRFTTPDRLVGVDADDKRQVIRLK